MLWLLIGYLFLFIHRPFEVWPWLGEYRVELLYVLVLTGVWLAYPNKRMVGSALQFPFYAFAAAMVVCWFASPWSASNQREVEDYLKLFAFFIVLVTVIHRESQLQCLILAFLGCHFLFMTHSLWEYHNGRHQYTMEISRMVGVNISTGHPNDLAAGILYSLPLVVPVWTLSRAAWLRCFAVGYVLLGILCVALTGSRSGLVGLVLCLGWMVLRTGKHRLRHAIALLVALCLGFTLLPSSLSNRFETIFDSSAGPISAKISAQGRVDGFYLGLSLWSENVLLGIGPGAWRAATGATIDSHNLYGQLLGEMGLLGVFVFIGVLCAFRRAWRRIRDLSHSGVVSGGSFLPELSSAIGFTVVLMLFQGNFGHNLYRFTWLWYGGFLIIAKHCAESMARRDVATDVAPRHPVEVAYWRRAKWTGMPV